MRYAVILILSAILTVQVQAQRRLPGQQGVQATIGSVDFSKKSIHYGLALSKFTKNGNRWVFGAEYFRKKLLYRDQYIPVEYFAGEAGYNLTFLSDGSKTFFFSLGLSGLLGYELVNRDKILLHDGSSILTGSGFLYGCAFSLGIETYLADRVILLTGFRQLILPASSVNKFHNQLFIGIKCIIN